MAITSEQTASGLDLPERAQALQPLLMEHAPAGDAAGRLADEVVEALHREGLWGMWVPKVLGGSELDQQSSLRTIEALTYGDPSVGWVHMAASLAIGTGGAYLGRRGRGDAFRRRAVPGDRRPGDTAGNGRSDRRRLLAQRLVELRLGHQALDAHPHAGARRGHGRAADLRYTGRAGDVDRQLGRARPSRHREHRLHGRLGFVPESYTHFAVTEEPKRGGPVYGQGVIGFALICHTGWALGIGRRMLDELISLVQAKAGRPGAQSDSDSFVEGMERAEGSLRAARALVFEVWADAQETLERGEQLSVRQHTLLRLATTHVTWAAHDVGMFVYLSGGTTALREGPIQRLFRDLHAGTQHLIVSPLVRRNVGREIAGLAGGRRWQFVDLVDAA